MINNMSKFIYFKFECYGILVKTNHNISADDFMARTFEMNENGKFEDYNYEEILDAVMKDMNVEQYEIIDCKTIDMEYAFEMN
jgi:hypothetical protein